MFKIIFPFISVIGREGGVMPYAPEHKQKTRQRIVGAAASLFNRKGFAEVTIGEIMAAADLTHGGFYRHFGSNEELYAEAVSHFLRKEAPARWQKGPTGARMPDAAFAKFVVDAYLSRDHLEDVGGSCPLVGLSTDVARSPHGVKAAYREVAQSMVKLFNAQLKGRAARDQAMVLVSLCVGGMVLARAFDDQDLAHKFLDTARKHALNMTGWRDAGVSIGRPARQ
jgi:TetR/AcrR family transcriptional regulator, transcriptional repressor for nem operon